MRDCVNDQAVAEQPLAGSLHKCTRPTLGNTSASQISTSWHKISQTLARPIISPISNSTFDDGMQTQKMEYDPNFTISTGSTRRQTRACCHPSHSNDAALNQNQISWTVCHANELGMIPCSSMRPLHCPLVYHHENNGRNQNEEWSLIPASHCTCPVPLLSSKICPALSKSKQQMGPPCQPGNSQIPLLLTNHPKCDKN